MFKFLLSFLLQETFIHVYNGTKVWNKVHSIGTVCSKQHKPKKATLDTKKNQPNKLDAQVWQIFTSEGIYCA